MLQGSFTHNSSALQIGKVVGKIDSYPISFALLIFGCGVCELVVSDINLRQQVKSELRGNLLNIDSLDSHKQKLTKVIIVALIVIAFKLIVSLDVNTVSDRLEFCGGVLMLALSSWLISRSSPLISTVHSPVCTGATS